nr:RNA-directed DNA polymerase, eukaryota, reverse transcriptase zinc-binding domain protein [Tanacetum cinerariifolium]
MTAVSRIFGSYGPITAAYDKEHGYTTAIQKLKCVQTTEKKLISAHMKPTYTTRRGCNHNTEDVCHPLAQMEVLGNGLSHLRTTKANRLVGALGNLVDEVQSNFVLNKEILYGPFILNEVIQWCKSKKKQNLVFKVNFEKAYDLVRWDYLDDVLKKFGFGDRWCRWIQSCLSSFKASIIVNGCPTEVFQFQKGMFEGVSIGSSLQLSHLFYADDVVFIGQWSDSNINTIVQVLECLFRASGLRINMHKSKLMGIAVDDDKVTHCPLDWLLDLHDSVFLSWRKSGRLDVSNSSLGWNCSTPIYYMSMFEVPMHVLNRNEAMRGRFFNGVDDKEKRMMWITWRNVSTNDNNSLWTRVIMALHGENRSIGTSSKHASTWLDIVRDLKKLKSRRIDLLGFVKKSNITLAHKLDQDNVGLSLRRCPRGGTEFEQFTSLMASLEGYTLPEIQDRCVWSLTGLGEFSVASVRRYINDHMLLDVSSKTRWLKAVSIKVIIHAWKVKLDSLFTRFNFPRRGLDIQWISCPICSKAAETTSHIFFSCSMIRDIYRKISTWWDFHLSEVSLFEEWRVWLSDIHL